MHTNKLIQIAELTSQLELSRQAIAMYTNVAEQLAKDDCQFEMSIIVHNMDIHKKNLALKQIHVADAVGAMLSGSAANQVAMPSCSNRINDSLDDTSALRIVAAIIHEKRKVFNQIKHDLEALLQVTANPIFSLHNQTA